MKIINVLIIDDSSIVHVILEKVLEQHPEINIIGSAYDGEEGVKLVRNLSPDVIIMDISMPKMNGLDAIQEIMNDKPTPIIVFSAAGTDSVNISFKAIELGAVEIIEKPFSKDLSDLKKHIENKLLNSIKTFANFKVIRRIKKHKMIPADHSDKKAKNGDDESKYHVTGTCDDKNIEKDKKKIKKIKDFPVIGIAASTGGPQTIRILVNELASKKLHAGFVIVQHMAEGFIQGFCDWLTLYTSIPVIIPGNGTNLLPDNIYIAPEGYHLIFDEKGKFAYLDSPPIQGIRPSADLLFKSLGEVYKERVISVILTGMGSDGTRGIVTIKENGGYIISQDKDSSIIFGMPKSAIDTGLVDIVLNITDIACFLEKKYNERFEIV